LKKIKFIIWVLLLLLIVVISGYSQRKNSFSDVKTEIIKDPKPTHRAKTVNTLKLVKIITPDIDDEHFIAQIGKIQVDRHGNIYVYDHVSFKFFKFDKNYKFIKIFGRVGKGPGEYQAYRYLLKDFRIFENDTIYFNDMDGFKNIAYDLEGKLLHEWKYPRRVVVLPIRVNNGQWLAYTRYTFDILDKNIKKHVKTLLTVRDFTKKNLSGPTDTMHIMISGNIEVDRFSPYTFGVIGRYTGKFYYFKNEKLINSFQILPERWINSLKVKVKKSEADKKKHVGDPKSREILTNTFYPTITDFFSDRDNQEEFYVGGVSTKNIHNPLYKFNVKGDLISAWGYPKYNGNKDHIGLDYCCKRNGLIYATDVDKIYIFKEER